MTARIEEVAPRPLHEFMQGTVLGMRSASSIGKADSADAITRADRSWGNHTLHLVRQVHRGSAMKFHYYQAYAWMLPRILRSAERETVLLGRHLGRHGPIAIKKPRKHAAVLVAPTGIEPVFPP
jgi:hypothetical protein